LERGIFLFLSSAKFKAAHLKIIGTLKDIFERLLEWITIILMVSLAGIVIVSVAYRWAGDSLVWYDEVASVGLAWLTYYASALAAVKRAHIGVPGLVAALKPKFRVPTVVLAEACILVFFVMLAVLGLEVLEVLEGDTMVSLPEITTTFTQSVIPIGAILFIIAELLNLPSIIKEARDGAPAHGHA
jgi:TRAP-type C4-dicarboxylate transport system permease small subunit